MSTITPFLGYATEAEEAARFHAALFPASRVERVVAMPSQPPAGPSGCADLADIDRDWHALLDGGAAQQCGRQRDR